MMQKEGKADGTEGKEGKKGKKNPNGKRRPPSHCIFPIHVGNSLYSVLCLWRSSAVLDHVCFYDFQGWLQEVVQGG